MSDIRQRMQVGPLAATASWLCLLIVLNATVNPLVSGVTFVACAVTAWRARYRRLIVVALLVGIGLVLVIPGVAIVDGSWTFARVDGAGGTPELSLLGVMRAAGSLVRVPAQVVAIVALLLVPAASMLAGLARISPRSSVLAALTLRMLPALRQDVEQHRAELESRGMEFARPASLMTRINSWRAVWAALIAGAFDRAFATAAALETRGYGMQRPTTTPLELLRVSRSAERLQRHRDQVLLALVVTAVVVLIAGRVTDAIDAPMIGVLSGSNEHINVWHVVLAALCGTIGLLPVFDRRTDARPALDTIHTQRVQDSTDLHNVGGSHLTLRAIAATWPDAGGLALDVADLQIAAGSFVVITGASGSGKSTLINVITGLLPFSTGGTLTGTITIDSNHVEHLPAHARHGRIASLFQDPEHQVIVGTVAEEVAFGLRHRGIAITDIDLRVHQALSAMNCLHLARRDSATLSGGELQRVLLAAALAARPHLLILDEPASSLDAGGEQSFWDAVQQLQRLLGTTVIVSEHRLEHLLHRADRVIELVDGRMSCDVAAGDVIEQRPELVRSPYAGLAPAPPAAGGTPRVTIDHLDIAVPAIGHGVRSVVRELTAQLYPGSIVTLEGHNGAGKSTLLRALRGLPALQQHTAQGRVSIDGRLQTSVAHGASSIAYVSQQAGPLLHQMTVYDEANAMCRQLGTGSAAVMSALQAALLDGFIDRHPADLSVGQRQRLAIVAATAHRPAVWLLDEPTRGMDAAARRWLATWVLAHAAAGGVVIVATHDSQLAAAISTHRLVLDAATGAQLMRVERSVTGDPDVMTQRPYPSRRDHPAERSPDGADT